MERRDFLKIAMGFVAGGAALAATAQAAPVPPVSGALIGCSPGWQLSVEPAVVSQDEVDRIKPEEVRWHHHHHGHWHHFTGICVLAPLVGTTITGATTAIGEVINEPEFCI